MNNTDESLLEKIYEKVEENNKMLHSMRNSQRMQSFMRVFYWILIIGISVWSLQALGPMLGGITQSYEKILGVKLPSASSFSLPKIGGFDVSKTLNFLDTSPQAAQNAIDAAKQGITQ